MADAIVRTLFRLLVSRRNLLEWVTAAQAKVSPRLNLGGFYRQMAGGVAIAAVRAVLVVLGRPTSLGRSRAVLASLAAVAGRRAMGEPAPAVGVAS